MDNRPYAIGARVKYDPSHMQNPRAKDANVTHVNDLGDGTYTYSIVTRDSRTARPELPALENVAAADLFVPTAQPGPGNDV